ncbi:MAG TPA: hypothetical protein VKJ45_23240, partial [Blastocatellia bacterium]|nr:hypothetical protein [Blastocatellia bacterium]
LRAALIAASVIARGDTISVMQPSSGLPGYSSAPFSLFSLYSSHITHHSSLSLFTPTPITHYSSHRHIDLLGGDI